MGKRILVSMAVMVATVLLIAGVAAAAAGLSPDEEQPVGTTLAETTDTLGETTDTLADTTDTTLADEGDEGVETTLATTPDEDEDPAALDDEDAELGEASEVHPDNFGGTISSLRHAGDHTPAAVLKGHKVPGWTKKQVTTTEATTVQGDPEE